MGYPLKLLTTISILSLAHSIYSAYESTTLPIAPSSSPSSSTSSPQIPTDIRIQTLLSTFLLLTCIVLSSAPFRPIRWNEWAGRIEREGWDPNMPTAGKYAQDPGVKVKGGAGNPYLMLEERRGFWDVRSARAGFAGWVREGGK